MIRRSVARQFTNSPGYASLADNVKALKLAHTGSVGNFSAVMMKDGSRVSPTEAGIRKPSFVAEPGDHSGARIMGRL
jgi:hypothetical protein